MKRICWPMALVALIVFVCAGTANAQQSLDKLEGILDAESAAEQSPVTPAPSVPTAAPAPAKTSIFRPGYLGLYAIEIDDQLVVEEVRPDSPAAAAKLRPGDVIVRLGAAQPHTLDEMSAALAELGVGARLPITVERGKIALSLTAVLGKRPASSRLVDAKPTPTPADPSGDAIGALRELDDLLADLPPDDEPAGVAPPSPAEESHFLKRVATLEAELKLISARMQILERTLDRVEKASKVAP